VDIIAAILKRPMIEIAEIVGLVILIISAIGFFVFLIIKTLHIKKIGVTGIECETVPKKPIFKRKRSK